MRFKAKARETGGSFVLTIPKPYVDNGQIELGKEYLVELSSPEPKSGVKG